MVSSHVKPMQPPPCARPFLKAILVSLIFISIKIDENVSANCGSTRHLVEPQFTSTFSSILIEIEIELTRIAFRSTYHGQRRLHICWRTCVSEITISLWWRTETRKILIHPNQKCKTGIPSNQWNYNFLSKIKHQFSFRHTVPILSEVSKRAT